MSRKQPLSEAEILDFFKKLDLDTPEKRSQFLMLNPVNYESDSVERTYTISFSDNSKRTPVEEKTDAELEPTS
jgi:hypothetical protein